MKVAWIFFNNLQMKEPRRMSFSMNEIHNKGKTELANSKNNMKNT